LLGEGEIERLKIKVKNTEEINGFF
jgi:hypothetical protein